MSGRPRTTSFAEGNKQSPNPALGGFKISSKYSFVGSIIVSLTCNNHSQIIDNELYVQMCHRGSHCLGLLFQYRYLLSKKLLFDYLISSSIFTKNSTFTGAKYSRTPENFCAVNYKLSDKYRNIFRYIVGYQLLWESINSDFAAGRTSVRST